MARAARVLAEPGWLAAAQQAADFIRAGLWRNGRLLATYKDGRAHLNAYLDDYAFLLAALIELLQTKFRPQDLAWAIELAEALLGRFEDRAAGGFFFTSHDHEALIHRAKPGHDNATPAGNGIAAQALLTLGHWLGEPRYVDAAERAVRAFARELAAEPSGFASLLVALADCLDPPTTAILQGDPAICAVWQRSLERQYRPQVRTLDVSGQPTLPAMLAKPHADTKAAATIWVCRDAACLPPMTTLEAAQAALAEAPGRVTR
jgi:uncharacterized protein